MDDMGLINNNGLLKDYPGDSQLAQALRRKRDKMVETLKENSGAEDAENER